MSTGAPRRALLDTSVFIALESGRGLRSEAIPDITAISVVTRAELRAGVLTADDISTRDLRIQTLDLAGRITAIPIDDHVARAWSQMRAYVAAAGGRLHANDMWIAATAAAHEIPVVTQDADFDALNGVAGLTVIPV